MRVIAYLLFSIFLEYSTFAQTKPDATNTGPNNTGALSGLPTFDTWVGAGGTVPPGATLAPDTFPQQVGRYAAHFTGAGTYSGFDLNGQIVINGSNITIENFILRNGNITVDGGSNIILRNFRMLGGNEAGKVLMASSASMTMEYGEIADCPEDSNMSVNNFTGRYLYIHDAFGDIFRPSTGNIWIEYSFVTRPGVPYDASASEKHSDCWQSFGMDNVTMIGNNFDATHGTGVNSAINLTDPNSNMTIENNWFSGGGYTFGYTPGGSGLNNIIRGNQWGTSGTGPVYPFTDSGTTLWHNNRWESTQEVINNPSGTVEQVYQPVAAPAGGSYSTIQSVSLTSATPASSIYYTTNGSNPTTGSFLYTSPISISSTLTLKAFAIKAGVVDSLITTELYDFETPANAIFNVTTMTVQ